MQDLYDIHAPKKATTNMPVLFSAFVMEPLAPNGTPFRFLTYCARDSVLFMESQSRNEYPFTNEYISISS